MSKLWLSSSLSCLFHKTQQQQRYYTVKAKMTTMTIVIVIIIIIIASNIMVVHSWIFLPRRDRQHVIRRSIINHSYDNNNNHMMISNMTTKSEEERIILEYNYNDIIIENTSMSTPILACQKVNVISPPMLYAPKWVWAYSWRGFNKYVLPILHLPDRFIKLKTTNDNNNTTIINSTSSIMKMLVYNQNNNLWVLWNKAIIASDYNSPIYEGNNKQERSWTYDMLPSYTRRIVKIIRGQYWPRLYHKRIEIRSVYLNTILQQEIRFAKQNNYKVRIISIGAGYDVRCTKLLSLLYHPANSTSTIPLLDEAWELDLDNVIQTKMLMLQRLQQRRRRRHESNNNDGTTTSSSNDDSMNIRLPHLLNVDLNEPSIWKLILNDIIKNKDQYDASSSTKQHSDDDNDHQEWYTIFISEAVFIYLKKGIQKQILQYLHDVILSNHSYTTTTTTDTTVIMNHNQRYDDNIMTTNMKQSLSSTTATKRPIASFCFADRIENCLGTYSYYYYESIFYSWYSDGHFVCIFFLFSNKTFLVWIFGSECYNRKCVLNCIIFVIINYMKKSHATSINFFLTILLST